MRSPLAFAFAFCLAAVLSPIAAQAAAKAPASPTGCLDEPQSKPRLVVMTDIGGDPDDRETMVRLMAYSNQVDIEGLVATPNSQGIFPEQIKTIVEAYGQVRDNLEKHEKGFPTAEYLLKRIASGQPISGIKGVGKGMDSAGSNQLIRVVDAPDPRPVWVTVWGGPSVLAQALWKVRATRSKQQLARFVAKLRIYSISDQDDSGPWIRRNFPKLFYIVNPGGNFHMSTWMGMAGDKFHGRFGGANWSLVTNEWIDQNIRSKGPLGAAYPNWKFQMEGDTPAILYLLDNGLNNPQHPNWGGWGGRYELYTPHTEKWFFEPEKRPIWTTVRDEVLGTDGEWHTTEQATVWRWREAVQNDFAARLDWTIKPYNQANHPPVPKIAMPACITAKAGQRIDLSAAGSSDPDGDALSYKWFLYEEAGTRGMMSSNTGVKQQITNDDQPEAWFTINTNRVNTPGTGTMHIILAVTDRGAPSLTRYKRVIINVVP